MDSSTVAALATVLAAAVGSGGVVTAIISSRSARRKHGADLLKMQAESQKREEALLQELRTQVSLLLLKMEHIEKKQDKHNGVIERTYELEKNVGVVVDSCKQAHHRIDELRDRK